MYIVISFLYDNGLLLADIEWRDERNITDIIIACLLSKKETDYLWIPYVFYKVDVSLVLLIDNDEVLPTKQYTVKVVVLVAMETGRRTPATHP